MDADAASGPTDRPSFVWGATTHVGGARNHNEDAFYVSDDVCVVADGMGGHQAGEVASQLVTKLVSEVFTARRLDVTELPRFVSALNAAVLRKGAENNTQGMGTTLVGVAVANNGDVPSAVVLHVGDSRCYRLVDGVLTQLTTDHSHVQDLIEHRSDHPGRGVDPPAAQRHHARARRSGGRQGRLIMSCPKRTVGSCSARTDCRARSTTIGSGRCSPRTVTRRRPPCRSSRPSWRVRRGDNVTVIVFDVHFPTGEPTDELPPDDLQLVAHGDVTAEVDVTPQPGVADGPVVESADSEMVEVSLGATGPRLPPSGRNRSPIAPPDAAAWEAPNPHSTDPTP